MTANNVYDDNGAETTNSQRSLYSPTESFQATESAMTPIEPKIEIENHKGFAPGGNLYKSESSNNNKKYRTVKIGRRTFEVVDSSGDVDNGETSPRTYHRDGLENSVDKWPVAENVYRRKRRKIPKPPASVISLPMSSVTAFSGFTAASSTSTNKPKRTKASLIRNSIIMLGREFCYAIEAGLTTPILLSIGLPLNLYSIVWVISPILGFILQPIIGNLSDRCKSSWGRRRPFILGLAAVVLIGMTFFLNGEQLVQLIGMQNNIDPSSLVLAAILVTVMGVVLFDFSADFIEGPIRAYAMDVCDEEDVKVALYYQALFTGIGGAFGYASGGISWTRDTFLGNYFPSDRQVVYVFAAIVFAICVAFNLTSISEKSTAKKTKSTDKVKQEEKRRLLGSNDGDDLTKKYDGNNNNDRSDKKTPTIIVSNEKPRSYSKKYSNSRRSKRNKKSLKVRKEELIYGTFAVRDGISYYIKDGFATPIQQPPHIILPQSPLPVKVFHAGDSRVKQWVEKDGQRKNLDAENGMQKSNMNSDTDVSSISSKSDSEEQSRNVFGNTNQGYQNLLSDGHSNNHLTVQKFKSAHDSSIRKYDNDLIFPSKSSIKQKDKKSKPSKPQEFGMKELFKSIISIPTDLKRLCICHLFGWMSFLCVVLFFTDFVGQEIYKGDPRAPPGSEENINYGKGVEMGNLGMTINAAASSVYCFLLKPFIRRVGPRVAYMFGYFAFCVGSGLMVIIPSPYVILGLSSLIGVMSATLYTLPYFLVAQYHEGYKKLKGTPQERGAGVDCALVTCMIQLAQIIVGLGIGALVVAMESVSVTLVSGCIVSFIGTLWAGFLVKY